MCVEITATFADMSKSNKKDPYENGDSHTK